MKKRNSSLSFLINQDIMELEDIQETLINPTI